MNNLVMSVANLLVRQIRQRGDKHISEFSAGIESDFSETPMEVQDDFIGQIMKGVNDYAKKQLGDVLMNYALTIDDYTTDAKQRKLVFSYVEKEEIKSLKKSVKSVGGEFMNHCEGCGKFFKKIFKCGKCGQAKYCGRECSLKGWKEGHKEKCAEFCATKQA